MDASKEIPRGEWLNPVKYPPPRNEKINLLTQFGISTQGFWGDDCVGWAKLLNTPDDIKEEMHRRYKCLSS